MQKNISRRKLHYFSDKLKRQLGQIPHHPLTIVQAPSGFGKTTAVREYLRTRRSPDACEFWYTCLGEPAPIAWNGICGLLANVNDEMAGHLRKLEMPTMETLLHLTAIFRDFSCLAETYLVIDNYQLVDCDIPHELMRVFAMHGNPKLHIIVITQQLAPQQLCSIHNTDMYTIDATAFFFERAGTASLFRMEGIRLTDDELERVFMSTDGWVSAIRLQIINFKETGSFHYTTDIEKLVENAIWTRLSPEEKEFLLSVSVMDSFSARQGAIMTGQDILPEPIEALLKTNDFIRYFPEKGIYTMHSILQDYLRNRFYHHQPRAFQERTLRLAGQSYIAISQYYTAAQFFFKVKDFDAILSMPLGIDYLANQKERGLASYVETLVHECPEEILCQYPFHVLILAYTSLFERQMDIFRKLCRLIRLSIQKNHGGLHEEDLRRLTGEYMFLLSFTVYSDIKRMSKIRKKALDILKGPSSIMMNDMPFAFGSTSLLSIFWNQPGKLDDTLRDMEDCLPYYLQLTHGHGTGADSVLRAEAFLLRGNDAEAEILCHKALYTAQGCQQANIGICAEQILAQIAILRGDVEGYFSAIKNIQRYSKENSDLYILRMAELSMSCINFTLGITDHYSKWLYDTETLRLTMYAPAIPYALTLHSKFLVVEKRYHEFYGISQSVLDAAADMRYLLPQVYQLILLAVAKRNNGHALEAQDYLKQALALALPDQLYLLFAQETCMEDFLSELPVCVFQQSGNADGTEASPGPAARAQQAIARESNHLSALKALCRRQQRGAGIIRKAILQAKSPLTPREREIAHFAKDRLSAREIADKLYISETTVRAILRSIYSKLGIHSKTELNSIEF